MYENFTRRGFFGAIASAMAGVGSALMFRKFRKPEASVPNTPRLLQDHIDHGIWAPTEFSDKPLPLDDVEFVSNYPEPEVLAHPTLKEQDDALLFEDDGYKSPWLKDHISGRLGEVIFNEEGGWKGYAQGGLTDEEYAAFQRYLNNDYPVIKMETATDISQSGGCSEKRIAA